jgi:YVTN family beta-propeller protein
MKCASLKMLLVLLIAAPCCFGTEAGKILSSANQKYLSPTALAATSDGKTLFIACATANQVLVFDTAESKVTKTIPVSESPLGLALSPNEAQLYVTCGAPESTIHIVDVARARVIGKIRAGHTAMAPVCSPDGKVLMVCNRFNNSVAFFDLAKRKEIGRVQVPREPVAAAVTPDGRLLFVANHIHAGRSDVDYVASSVSVIDTAARKVIREIQLPNGSTLLRGVAMSPDGKFAAVTHTLARFHLPTTQIERGWINNNALSLIDVEGLKLLNTVLLDNIDSGAGNPWGVAWSADGKLICVTHAGTHELSVINAPALLEKLAKMPQAPGGAYTYTSASRSAVDVPNDLAFLVGLRQRIKLTENGPRDIVLIGNRAFTANYFSDSLSVVDLAADRCAPVSIALGEQPPLSVVRQGELNFNDASVCFQGWQSCASCHSSDARVDGMNWDLLNDGIGNPKNGRSLLLAHQTPPSMSLGVRATAEVAVRAGIRHSLFVVLPEEFSVAIDEYLKALQPIPSPHLVKGKLSKSAQRGKKLFFDDKTACSVCHSLPHFTNLNSYDVGTIGRYDNPTNRFDTPTLIEIWRTGPYLHDGSAATLEEVITLNKEDKHGVTSHLTPEQIDDLVAYMLSL